jgi:hypothetical protein
MSIIPVRPTRPAAYPYGLPSTGHVLLALCKPAGTVMSFCVYIYAFAYADSLTPPTGMRDATLMARLVS